MMTTAAAPDGWPELRDIPTALPLPHWDEVYLDGLRRWLRLRQQRKQIEKPEWISRSQRSSPPTSLTFAAGIISQACAADLGLGSAQDTNEIVLQTLNAILDTGCILPGTIYSSLNWMAGPTFLGLTTNKFRSRGEKNKSPA
jgi:hypothetical protein